MLFRSPDNEPSENTTQSSGGLQDPARGGYVCIKSSCFAMPSGLHIYYTRSPRLDLGKKQVPLPIPHANHPHAAAIIKRQPSIGRAIVKQLHASFSLYFVRIMSLSLHQSAPSQKRRKTRRPAHRWFFALSMGVGH